MTSQEREMLSGLISKVQQTQLTERDPEAQQLLEQGLSNDRDALYVLAQTVLVQNLALNQARAQVQQLQQQVQHSQQAQQPAKPTSFLGSLFHSGGSGSQQQAPPPPQYQAQPGQQWQNVPPPQYQGVPAGYVPQAYGVPMSPGGTGGFLRSAATTAAGVAAGALAFEGIESMFHHGGGGGFGGGGFGGGGFGGGGNEYISEAPREEIVNNYYGDAGSGRGEDRGDLDRGNLDQANFDSSDYGGGSDAGLQDASYDTSTDAGDVLQDDSSSFDTSGDDFSGDFGGDGGDNSSLI